MCSCFNTMSLNKGQIVFVDKPFISYSRFHAEDLVSSLVLKEKINFLLCIMLFTEYSPKSGHFVMYGKIRLCCNTLNKLEQITSWLLEGQTGIELGIGPRTASS